MRSLHAIPLYGNAEVADATLPPRPAARELERGLGRGGMAEVYHARVTRAAGNVQARHTGDGAAHYGEVDLTSDGSDGMITRS